MMYENNFITCNNNRIMFVNNMWLKCGYLVNILSIFVVLK